MNHTRLALINLVKADGRLNKWNKTATFAPKEVVLQ